MLLTQPNVYQSFTSQPPPFYYIAHIVAIVINHSNLFYQYFTSQYQSDPVIYITTLPMITNKFPVYHYQLYHWQFSVLGRQCITNHQFTNGIREFINRIATSGFSLPMGMSKQLAKFQKNPQSKSLRPKYQGVIPHLDK